MSPSSDLRGPELTHDPDSGRRVPRPSRDWFPVAATRPTTLSRDLGIVVLVFLFYRGLLFGADYVGRALTAPLSNETHYAASRFWDGYIRHDSLHYHSIIREGYRVETKGRWKGLSTNAAFFPLYPYSVKLLASIGIPGHGPLFASVWPAGLVLSNVCLLLALFYMLRIARMGLDEGGARRSLVYLMVYPTSFFFSAFYTEGLFLLTTVAAFYHFLKGRYFVCGVWGLLAALTRPPGVMLLPAFLIGHLWERRFKVDRSDLSLLWLALIPCGLAAVMGTLYLTLGDPLAFSHAQTAWGRAFMPPPLTLWRNMRAIHWSLPLGNFPNTIRAIDLVSSVVFLALPFFLPRGFHKSLPIYSMLLVLMPLSTGTTVSLTRFEIVAFPGFYALARFGKVRAVDRLIVFGSALLLILLKVAFSNGYSVF